MQLTILRLSTILHIVLWGIIIYYSYKNKSRQTNESLKIIKVYFFAVFILDAFSILADFYIKNAQFLNYIYIPVEYAILVLFLEKLQYSKLISIVLLLSAIAITYYEISYAVIDQGYTKYNPIGGYFSSGGLVIISLYILSTIFKKANFNIQLRYNPAFWITISIFSINLLDLISTFIQASNYISLSNDGYYLMAISRNFIKAVLMMGYFIGVKL